MLTRDARFEGWTTEDWSRFLSLWKPRAAPEREPTRARGGLVVIHDGGRVRKMLHTHKGRIEPGTPWPPPAPENGSVPRGASPAAPLELLAKEHHASWALSAHLGALDEVMERFGARARRDDDLTAQSLLVVGIVREMIAEGAIASWPVRLRGVRPPTEAMVHRALDAMCSDGRAVALGLFKDEELWTAFVARRRGNGFDVIAGPDELRSAMGLLSGDWRRDYRHLVHAVEERYAPLSLGCFAEVAAIRALQVDSRPGAWARAVAVRDVILSPVPMAIGVALGFDGTRYALDKTKAVTARIDPFGFVDPLVRSVRSRLGERPGGKGVSSALGFDPLAALRALLQRD
jgi:hypothetical protein